MSNGRVVGLVAVLLLGISRLAGAEDSPRPNIFFFFADDWGRYAGIYRDFAPNEVVRTPTFDRFAQAGIRFNHAHVSAPSCTPCRSSLMSGRHFYQTGLGAFLRGRWDGSLPAYPLILQDAGYHIGFTYKVWGPGEPANAPHGGEARAYNGAGTRFRQFSQNATRLMAEGKSREEAKRELYDEGLENFRAFLRDRQPGQPFCYFFGPTNTHRKWVKGSGRALWDLNPDDLRGRMPAFLSDVPEVREDLCDYLGEVMALDEMFGRFLQELDATGLRENTLIVASGDHGIPGFPRGKCNLYGFGTEVALFVQLPGNRHGGRVVEDFVNLMDLAPTFLDLAGGPIPATMTGRSLRPILESDRSGWIDPQRDHVVTGRERHVPKARPGDLPYPQRALRTRDFLYIRNFAPERWPMGDAAQLDSGTDVPSAEQVEQNTHIVYADMDAGPTKAWMVTHRDEPTLATAWRLGFEKRPGEELYDLRRDPDGMVNVATDPAYAETRRVLAERLMTILQETGDPRVTGDGLAFERPPFVE